VRFFLIRILFKKYKTSSIWKIGRLSDSEILTPSCYFPIFWNSVERDMRMRLCSHLIQLHQFVVVTRLLILSCCPSRVLQSIHQTSELEAHTTLKALVDNANAIRCTKRDTLCPSRRFLYLLPVGIFSDQMKEHRDIDFAKKTDFLQCGRSSNSNSPPVARQRSSSLLYKSQIPLR